MLMTNKDNYHIRPCRFSCARRPWSKNRRREAEPDFFCPGRSGRLRLLSSERPGKTYRRFARTAKRPPSRFSPPATLSERSPSRRCLGCDWPRPLPLTPAWRSRSDRDEMIRVMHDEPAFADLFLKFLLARSMRTQADLVDQLFNSSEKRLARILLLMAEFGKPGEPETFIPSHYAGNPGGDDRHHAIPRQLLYEPLSQARLYRATTAASRYTSRCSMWSCSINCPSTTPRSRLLFPAHKVCLIGQYGAVRAPQIAPT